MTIESRRGEVSLYARADDGTPRGAVFVPFCYYEAAINKLTNAALDPFAKIPEFKYCAVRVQARRRGAAAGQLRRRAGARAPGRLKRPDWLGPASMAAQERGVPSPGVERSPGR